MIFSYQYRHALAGTRRRRGSPATLTPVEFASSCCATYSHRSSLAVDHSLVAVDPKLTRCATLMAHPGMAASRIGAGKKPPRRGQRATGSRPIEVKGLCWTPNGTHDNLKDYMPPENYKGYISPQHAIGGRKTRSASAVIRVELQMTHGAYADHRSDITPPVWPAPSRQSSFATAPGLCCAPSDSDPTSSIRYRPATNVLVVDAEDTSAAVEKACTTVYL